MLFRKFKVSDADAVSSLIRRSTIQRDNRGYSLEQIHSICNHYSEQNLIDTIKEKYSLVLIENGKIIATASLRGEEAMALFIDPFYQGKGLGTKLMSLLEKEAIRMGISRIWGVSALSAVGFYKMLGYSAVGEKLHPQWGRGIFVEKKLK